MLVVNLFGGPGSGKSTTAAGIFSLLKLHDINVELIAGFAEDFTCEHRHKALENQYYIWAKQYHHMWRLRDDMDVIITDSPLILSLMYGEICETHRRTVLDTFVQTFDNMNYVVKAYDSKGRNQIEYEAKYIDDAVRMMLDCENISYDVITGDYNGINNVTYRILERLEIEILYQLKHKLELS